MRKDFCFEIMFANAQMKKTDLLSQTEYRLGVFCLDAKLLLRRIPSEE